jgi:hypothetical protein
MSAMQRKLGKSQHEYFEIRCRFDRAKMSRKYQQESGGKGKYFSYLENEEGRGERGETQTEIKGERKFEVSKI